MDGWWTRKSGKQPIHFRYLVTIKASPGYYDLIKYLVPFVAIVGFCFVVLFISLVGPGGDLDMMMCLMCPISGDPTVQGEVFKLVCLDRFKQYNKQFPI